MTLKVFTLRYTNYAQDKTRCDWLGHFSYRCGSCKKGYFKVKSEDDHPDECPACKVRIHVEVDHERDKLL